MSALTSSTTGALAFVLLLLLGVSNARLVYFLDIQGDSSSSESVLSSNEEATETISPFSWVLSILEKQKQLDYMQEEQDTSLMLEQLSSKRYPSAMSDCQHNKEASKEFQRSSFSMIDNTDMIYDGDSTMNGEQEADVHFEDFSERGATTVSELISEPSSSQGPYDQSAGSLLESLLTALMPSTPYAHLEEPVYEPTTSGTITYLGPFAFFTASSISSSSEYEQSSSDKDEYINDDSSIAYYFQGIYSDDSYYENDDDSDMSLSAIFSSMDAMQALSFSTLVAAAVVVFILALRSYLQLRCAMRRYEQGSLTYGSQPQAERFMGQSLCPVMVERNGRTVQGYLLLPNEDEVAVDHFHARKGDMSPVVVAKDLL